MAAFFVGAAPLDKATVRYSTVETTRPSVDNLASKGTPPAFSTKLKAPMIDAGTVRAQGSSDLS